MDIAVSYVIDFFETNPDEPLLSLGVNDRTGFSETDIDPDLINSVGRPSASHSYYQWLNTVVSRVLQQEPSLADRIFPVLAYDNVLDPPEFDVHPNVVVMITKEAHAWADRDGSGHDDFAGLFEMWSDRCETLALYDYSSGHRYLAPRLYTEALQEAYQYAHEHGMRHSYSDMVPAPVGEGPKTWVYTKMLWDLEADVTALSREWCDRVVGPSGGSALHAFYQLWEDFWSAEAQQTPFWDFGRGQIYFNFQLYDYLAAVPAETVEQAVRLLADAATAADTPPRRARAALLQESFSYYERGLVSHPRIVPPPTSSRQGVEQARTMVEGTADRVSAAQERIVIKERHDDDPILRQRIDHYRYNQIWTGFNGSEFWNLHDHLVAEEPDGGPVTTWLRGVTTRAAADDPGARMAWFVLASAAGELSDLAPNGDFAEGETDVPPWQISGTMHRAADVGVDGTAGLVVPPLPDIPRGRRERSLILPITITPGLCAFRMRYRSEVADLSGGTASVKIHLWTPSGANIHHYSQPMRLLADTGSTWTSVGLCEDVPAESNGQPVGQLRLVASILGLESEAPVIIDSVSVFSEEV